MKSKKEKFFDALLDFLEENIELATEGLDEIIKKMVEEGKLPQSSTPTARNENG